MKKTANIPGLDESKGSREHLDAMARGARWCYFVPSDANYDGSGFVPSLVVEGVAGHVPMTGQGAHAQPWYWGDTYEQAKQTCVRANARRGISAAAASAIVASSMRESFIGKHVPRTPLAQHDDVDGFPPLTDDKHDIPEDF